MDFKIIATDKLSSARCGVVATGHGNIPTPVFMPVGTTGTVKGVQQRDLDKLGASVLLANTYHLYLRPGLEVIEKAGGLHRFINWEKPLLTDSGGYQVYSLAERRKITEKGVKFQSHIDGSAHHFTPESAIDIQRTIGADIVMAFDECTPYPCEFEYAANSMELTHRWLKRCCDRFDSTEAKYNCSQSFFPIVQGNVYKDLREKSAECISSFEREGNAIGGLSVGEPHEVMYEMTETVCSILPANKPRYLMGVGTPSNILECIALGVDMFDCVIPTRNGRNGQLFTKKGIINIKNKKWEMDCSPVDPDGTTFVDSNYSKAYLRHLIMSNEMLGLQIASIHNLGFYTWLLNESRKQIEEGTFLNWKNKIVKQLSDKI